MVVADFLRELDDRWTPKAEPRIKLRIIGSTALMLQTAYARGTKDSDVIETDQIKAIAPRLRTLAGPDSDLYRRHRLYIELVSSGILFRRQKVVWRTIDALDGLASFEVEVLDVLDVVVSKLKRLHHDDLDDIRAMVDGGHIDHGDLIACFRDAVDFFGTGAFGEDLPKYRDNLHQVERDIFGLSDVTPIELPRWVEDD